MSRVKWVIEGQHDMKLLVIRITGGGVERSAGATIYIYVMIYVTWSGTRLPVVSLGAQMFCSYLSNVTVTS